MNSIDLAVLCAFYFLFPALAIYACGRWSALDKIGAGMLCYGTGILISALGLVPDGAAKIQEPLLTVTVPLSIPLILFSVDIRRWFRLAGKTALAFAAMIVSVLAAVSIAYFFLNSRIDEAWKVAGMAIGVYTGGTANLNAIGLALRAPEHLIVLANTADMLACAPWFLFILAFGQRALNKFLRPFVHTPADGGVISAEDRVAADINDYSGIFSREKFFPLLRALAIAVLIFAAGGALYSVSPPQYNMAVLMLAITTLGVSASLVPAVRRIPMTFQLGQYVILVFCVAVGSMANLSLLAGSAPWIMLFIAGVVYGSWFIHILLCRVLAIDTDTAIITSVAALFSPPFVPVVASALKNRDVVVSGLSTGIIGYIIGNYLGIFFAYLLLKISS